MSTFALILAFTLQAADPPGPSQDLIKQVAQNENAAERERSQYTYRQTLVLDELDDKGQLRGSYREVRDVVFSPNGKRSEEFIGRPTNTLRQLKLTDEDFQDLRHLQPALFTVQQLWFYEIKDKGEETIDGRACWVWQIRPRQVLQGQRFFEGLVWIDQTERTILRTEGQAVPQVRTLKQENLFPHFTTIRAKVNEKWWFPFRTLADDTLYFRVGPQRVRLTVRYAEYKKFKVETKIQFPELP